MTDPHAVPQPAHRAAILWTSPRAVMIVLAVLVVAKLVVAWSTGLLGDEAYYTLWSLYPLRAGYFDHPPAVVWFIRAGQLLLGDSALASRLAAILATLLCAAAIWRTAIVLFADRTIAALATLWFSLSLGTVAGLLVVTPDAPSMLFWTLAIWAAAELLRSANGWWWIAFGVFAGLGLQAKYTGFFLGAGILVWLVAYPQARRWFRKWHLYVGGLIALAIFAPVLQWNIDHDFSSLEFQLGRSTEAGPSLAGFARYFPDYVGALAGLLWPGVFLFLVSGIVLFLLRRRRRGDAAIGLLVLTAAPTLIYFAWHTVHSRVQGNWTLPLFAQLALIAAGAAVTWRPGNARAGAVWLWLRRWQAPLAALCAGLFLAVVAIRPIPLPAGLPTDQMDGWPAAVDEIAAIAREYGTGTVYADYYQVVASLAVEARFGGRDLTVLPAETHERYAFMRLSDAAAVAPSILVVRSDLADEPVQAREVRGAAAEFLSSVVRKSRTGRPIDRLDVYRVAG